MGQFHQLVANDIRMQSIIEKCGNLLYQNEYFCLSDDIDRASITLEGTFKDAYGLDSLETVEYIMVIEKKFNLGIPDDEAEHIDCLGDICNWIYLYPHYK